MLKRIFILFLSLIILPIKSFDLASSIVNKARLNPFTTLGITSGAAGLAAYYKYKRNKIAKEQEQQKLLNEELAAIQGIRITPQTIFAFDINDVIIQPDFNEIWNIIRTKVLSKHKTLLLSALMRPHLYSIILKQIVQKSVTPEQVLSKIVESYEQFNPLSEIGLELANAQKEVPGMFKLIDELKQKGFPLLLLTNVGEDQLTGNSSSSIDMLKKRYPIFNYFDYEASLLTTKRNNFLRKPQEEFYKLFKQKFVNKYGTSRLKDLVFVDDRLKNIIAARLAGIQSIWFISTDDLTKKLTSLGLEF